MSKIYRLENIIISVLAPLLWSWHHGRYKRTFCFYKIHTELFRDKRQLVYNLSSNGKNSKISIERERISKCAKILTFGDSG